MLLRFTYVVDLHVLQGVPKLHELLRDPRVAPPLRRGLGISVLPRGSVSLTHGAHSIIIAAVAGPDRVVDGIVAYAGLLELVPLPVLDGEIEDERGSLGSGQLQEERHIVT